LIEVTCLNGSRIVINADLIEHIKIGVDTVISLTNGKSFVVTEEWQELVDRIVQFKRRIMSPGGCLQ